MKWHRQLLAWWDGLGWTGETEELIDRFLAVYAAYGGPKPMDKRREGETMHEYRARFVDWISDPASATVAASKFLRPRAGL